MAPSLRAVTGARLYVSNRSFEKTFSSIPVKIFPTHLLEKRSRSAGDSLPGGCKLHRSASRPTDCVGTAVGTSFPVRSGKGPDPRGAAAVRCGGVCLRDTRSPGHGGWAGAVNSEDASPTPFSGERVIPGPPPWGPCVGERRGGPHMPTEASALGAEHPLQGSGVSKNSRHPAR